MEIITWSKSQAPKLHFCLRQLKLCSLSRAQSPFHQLRILWKCIHYQARRPGAGFLLWSSSRIHQPHTHIYLQIIGKAKLFNCMYKVVVICLNPHEKCWFLSMSGNRGVWITRHMISWIGGVCIAMFACKVETCQMCNLNMYQDLKCLMMRFWLVKLNHLEYIVCL